MKGSSWRIPPAFKFRLLGYFSGPRRGRGSSVTGDLLCRTAMHPHAPHGAMRPWAAPASCKAWRPSSTPNPASGVSRPGWRNQVQIAPVVRARGRRPREPPLGTKFLLFSAGQEQDSVPSRSPATGALTALGNEVFALLGRTG